MAGSAGSLRGQRQRGCQARGRGRVRLSGLRGEAQAAADTRCSRRLPSASFRQFRSASRVVVCFVRLGPSPTRGPAGRSSGCRSHLPLPPPLRLRADDPGGLLCGWALSVICVASAAVEFMRGASERDYEAAGGGDSDVALFATALCVLVAELAVKVGLLHVEVVCESGTGEAGIACEFAFEECAYAFGGDEVEFVLLQVLVVALLVDE